MSNRGENSRELAVVGKMKSRVNLVAILLMLSYVARTLEGSRDEKHGGQKEYPVGKKVIKEVHNKVATQSAVLLRRQDKTKVAKTRIKNTGLGLSKDYLHESGNIESVIVRDLFRQPRVSDPFPQESFVFLTFLITFSNRVELNDDTQLSNLQIKFIY